MKFRWRWPPWTLWRFAVATMLVWGAAPFLTGKVEAWDTPAYYLCALAAAGFLAGLFEKEPSWWMYAGSILGQVLYPLIFLQSGPLAYCGCLFGALYSGLTAAAGLIGVVVRTLVDRGRPGVRS